MRAIFFFLMFGLLVLPAAGQSRNRSAAGKATAPAVQKVSPTDRTSPSPDTTKGKVVKERKSDEYDYFEDHNGSGVNDQLVRENRWKRTREPEEVAGAKTRPVETKSGSERQKVREKPTEKGKRTKP